MVHRPVEDCAWLFDLLKSQLFIEPHGRCQVAVCLQIELRIAGLSGPVLRQAHQRLAVALSLGRICQIQLLYLRTAGNGRKLSHANAAASSSGPSQSLW